MKVEIRARTSENKDRWIWYLVDADALLGLQSTYPTENEARAAGEQVVLSAVLNLLSKRTVDMIIDRLPERLSTRMHESPQPNGRADDDS